MSSNSETPLADLAKQMKRDWDDRAREDAKWFINCVKLGQSEEEFDHTGLPEVERFVTADLPLLTGGRDPRSLRMLEIGCGIGRMTRYLAEIFGEVYGTDVSSEMVLQARDRLRRYPNARFYETNGCDFTELPDTRFDFIFSVYVFQHVPSREIIFSNIRDAYRLLAPGGVFKFAVSGVMNEEFLRTPKNTWMGASVSEDELRQEARELGAQLVSLTGAGTQYCWTTLRKPARRGEPREARSLPRIAEIGRADDLANKQIPSRGEDARVGLLVSGLDPEEADANNVVIKLRERTVLPSFVGMAGVGMAGVGMAGVGMAGDDRSGRILVKFPIPEDDPGAEAGVRLVARDGASEAVTITILPPQPVSPKIQLISNTFDGGLDVYAEGPKSNIRLFTEGLNETASAENVRVIVGDQRLNPESISFLPGNAVWLVIAQLPEHTATGETEVRISFNDLLSLALPLRIN